MSCCNTSYFLSQGWCSVHVHTTCACNYYSVASCNNVYNNNNSYCVDSEAWSIAATHKNIKFNMSCE